MIRRKDTFGYIDFIRGKYSVHNTEHLQTMINEMSVDEKERILNNSFTDLWNLMWGEYDKSNISYKNEEHQSNKKFDILKNNGILKELIEKSSTTWTETEWEFPKGRRNDKEKDLDCALREFEEETGLSKNNISIIENILPFEECFVGTDNKYYKHKYFLAFMKDFNNYVDGYQRTEVSKIEWKTIEECLDSIRPYSLEKKNVIQHIYNILSKYNICCI